MSDEMLRVNGMGSRMDAPERRHWVPVLGAGVLCAAMLVGGSAAATTSSAAAGSPPSEADAGADAVVTAEWGDVTDRQENRSLTQSGAWAADRDATSLFSLTKGYGIQQAWADGVTGKGVTVAVIDTGVAPVPGLTTSDDKLVNGPDLSFEGQYDDTRYLDGFGHGTHLAGIVAGQDDGWDRRTPNPATFAGVAPEAQVLNLRVGVGDGGVDVSQVLAALDWVVEHGDEGGMKVRVVCLAYGTASVQPWQVDPLARAVEKAWQAGITVVAASGNDGLSADRLLMPAVDPHVLAVGATDTRGNADPADDVVADFTNGGSSERRSDVVAPGRSLVSLRVAGSYADTMSPEGRVTGDSSGRFFRGSGTSQATAYVAGVVALLTDKEKGLTPDEVKAVLMASARPLAQPAPAAGAGAVDVQAALALARNVKTLKDGAIVDSKTGRVLAAAGSIPTAWSSGTGSLELARGGAHVVDPLTGLKLTGEVDAQGAPWDGLAWAMPTKSRKSWDKGAWNGRVWAGDGFTKRNWKARAWAGSSWFGRPWASQSTGARWEARSWRGQDWSARSWREDSWSGRSWRSLY